MTTDARLAGRRALVTGGGRGIGRAIALRCAAEGADLVLAGRDTAALEAVADEVALLGRHASTVRVDLREPGPTVEALGGVGRVDLLVANSGVAGPTRPVWEVSPEEWEETFAVNVTGTFLTCRTIIPGMLSEKRGSIVVVGSMTGKRPLAGRTPYAASKTALIGLVRTAAADLGARGVRINLVSPGVVEGERLDGVIAAQAATHDLPEDTVRHELETASPLGRTVPPDDVAAAVAFLLSDDAASITGEDLNVSAGAVTY